MAFTNKLFVLTCVGICVFLVLITPRIVKQKNPTLAEMDKIQKNVTLIMNPMVDDEEMRKEPL